MSSCGGIFASGPGWACGPIGDACSKGDDAGVENWSYVGDRSGAYEKVYTYRFVGEGRGDFDFDNPPLGAVPPGSSPPAMSARLQILKWSMLCLGATGLITVCVITTLAIFSPRGAQGLAALASPTPSPISRATLAVTDDSSTSTTLFDCEAGFNRWKKSWSPAKKAYCCREYKRGCAEDEGQQRPIAGANATGKPYKCTDSKDAEAWSFAMRQWCCKHEDVGCPSKLPGGETSKCGASCDLGGLSGSCAAHMRRAAADKFAGDSDPCPAAWAEVGRHCPQCSGCSPDAAHCGAAPTPAPAPAPEPKVPARASQPAASSENSCGQTCPVGSNSLSCKAQVQALAASEFSSQTNGCLSAVSFVRKRCSACARCSPVDAGCAEWSPSKAQAAAPTAPPAAVPRAEGERGAGGAGGKAKETEEDELFDCNAGISDFARIWTLAKKQWCCKHKHRGCPPAVDYDCDAGLKKWQTGWSLFKKAWCCQHEFKGCPDKHSELFDCNAKYSTWQEDWSPGKQAWCCKHAARACTTTHPPDGRRL